MAVDVGATEEQLNELTELGPPYASGEEEATPPSPDGSDSQDTADDADDVDEQRAPDDEDASDGDPVKSVGPRKRLVRVAILVGLIMVTAVTTLAGWLAWRTHELHQVQAQRQLFLQVGRQGALNLTTIDYQHADADVQRVLDSATGTFYDDFSKRSKPFVDVLKQAQAKSVGTITEAGLESDTDHDAQVLVAVTVKTSNGAAAEQEPRFWRMRISVTKVGDGAKVSNVQFVP